MQRSDIVLLGIMAVILSTMSGCARTQLGENYGMAYLTMKEGQILNPDAGENLEPVTGLGGKAAATAAEAYRKSFEKPDAEFGRSMISSGVQTK